MSLSCVNLYQKYNLIVCQKWIDLKYLDLSCDKFYMQSTIAGYVQSIEVLYKLQISYAVLFFSFKQNSKLIFVLNSKC